MRLMRTAAHVAVASSVNAKVQRRQAQRWAAADQAAANQAALQQQAIADQAATAAVAAVAAAAPVTAAPTPAAAAPAVDPARRIELLKELAQLREAGILTEAEFAAQKAQILA